MFDTKQFGVYLAKLRKEKGISQSELADQLKVTRQAISKWENGDSFPAVTMLEKIAEVYETPIDLLVNYANQEGVKEDLEELVEQLKNKKMDASSIIRAAPFLKLSVLGVISDGFQKHGIDISHVVKLAAYIDDSSFEKLLEKATYEQLDEELLTKFIPFLSSDSLCAVFMKILNGELSTNLLPLLRPYYGTALISQIEAAVIEGFFEPDILKKMREF